MLIKKLTNDKLKVKLQAVIKFNVKITRDGQKKIIRNFLQKFSNFHQ